MIYAILSEPPVESGMIYAILSEPPVETGG
jgi:hypothetical protein